MATNSNPSVEMGVSDELEIRQNEIIESHWEDQKGKRIKTASLGDTVYFCLKTKKFEDGHKLKLQLRGTKGHNTEPLTLEIKNNASKVKLYIDPKLSTKTDPETSDRIELYWEARYEKKASLGVDLFWLGSDDIGKYLEVLFVKNRLFIKPSSNDDEFPELYSVDGEQMVVVQFIEEQAKDYVKGILLDKAASSTKKMAMRYALAKMEKGYMIDNMGRVYNPTTSSGTARKIYNRTSYTNEGAVIKTRMGRDIEFMTDKGMATTKGVSQIDHWAAKGMIIKGAIEKVGPLLDVFSVTQFGMNPIHSENFPIYLASSSLAFAATAVGTIGMLELDKVYNDKMFDQYLQKKLDDAKRQGLDAVRVLLTNREGSFYQAGYRLIQISENTASKIVQGKYTSIEDIKSENETDRNIKSISLLYKESKDQYSQENIIIIETFFYL